MIHIEKIVLRVSLQLRDGAIASGFFPLNWPLSDVLQRPLPGFVVLVTLSTVYALFQDTPALVALFFGLKAAVLAIVVEAVLRIGKRALRNWAGTVVLVALGFVAIFGLGVPFPLIVLGAARHRPESAGG